MSDTWPMKCLISDLIQDLSDTWYKTYQIRGIQIINHLTIQLSDTNVIRYLMPDFSDEHTQLIGYLILDLYLVPNLSDSLYPTYPIPDTSDTWYPTNQVPDIQLIKCLIPDLWQVWYPTCQIPNIKLINHQTNPFSDTYVSGYVIPDFSNTWYPTHQIPVISLTDTTYQIFDTWLFRWAIPNILDT